MHTVVKSILNIGTLIVFLMAHEWMKREDTAFKQGEFYVLTLSTLFGMYLMISAGHFLMFFIGLETASIPMAALIAFDKYRHNSSEAGAKYILTALFSSALLLFGLSMIYGSAGTLYFDDLPAHIDGNPLQSWHSYSSLRVWRSNCPSFRSTSGQQTFTKALQARLQLI